MGAAKVKTSLCVICEQRRLRRVCALYASSEGSDEPARYMRAAKAQTSLHGICEQRRLRRACALYASSEDSDEPVHTHRLV